MVRRRPELAVLVERRIGVRLQLSQERGIEVRRNRGMAMARRAGRKAARLPTAFEVARHGVGAHAEAIGHLLMGQAGADGVNDLLTEVEGICFHLEVNTSPL